MRHSIVDELEERRIVRRLTHLADAVEPLADDELDAILRGATSAASARPAAGRLRGRSVRYLPGIAAAAAAAVAIAVGFGHSESSPDGPQLRGTTPERLLSFPEGSALELLLSRAGAERPA